MSDVYKFRVTVELALATHESAKDVREFLRDYVEQEWAAIRKRLEGEPDLPGDALMQDYIDAVLKVDVRSKRLDDDAPIGPPVTIRILGTTCPYCAKPFPDQVVTQPPFLCPHCRKVIAVEADGHVR
jgi:hypothetical protein